MDSYRVEFEHLDGGKWKPRQIEFYDDRAVVKLLHDALCVLVANGYDRVRNIRAYRVVEQRQEI